MIYSIRKQYKIEMWMRNRKFKSYFESCLQPCGMPIKSTVVIHNFHEWQNQFAWNLILEGLLNSVNTCEFSYIVHQKVLTSTNKYLYQRKCFERELLGKIKHTYLQYLYLFINVTVLKIFRYTCTFLLFLLTVIKWMILHEFIDIN